MSTTRAWAWFGSGLAGSLGLFGLYSWQCRRDELEWPDLDASRIGAPSARMELHSNDPELEIHTVTPDAACEFVQWHHRHLPECNRRGIVHARYSPRPQGVTEMRPSGIST